MSEEIDAGRGGGEEVTFLFVTDDVEGVFAAEGARFNDVQFGSATALNREALPVAKQPDTAEKYAEHQGERADDADDGRASVGQGRKRQWLCRGGLNGKDIRGRSGDDIGRLGRDDIGGLSVRECCDK